MCWTRRAKERKVDGKRYKVYIVYMAVLNLRGVPDELACRLKADAALRGASLRDYCVLLLSGRGVDAKAADTHRSLGHASTRSEQDSSGLHHPMLSEQVSSPAAPTKQPKEAINADRGDLRSDLCGTDRRGDDPQPDPARVVGCPSCGSLSGHQKWCKGSGCPHGLKSVKYCKAVGGGC